jgi:hypothetical protein
MSYHYLEKYQEYCDTHKNPLDYTTWLKLLLALNYALV